jgi:flagellar hook-basal body protein
MFGTIYVGLSGLSAYSRGLQAVSNNVTNLNSTGFRGSVVSFNDVFSAKGNDGLSYSGSGRSAGSGVGMAESKLDFRQGQLRQTDRQLDLAIDGSGFLMLMKGDEVFYTRTGSFEVGKDGHIVLAGTDYRSLLSAPRANLSVFRSTPPEPMLPNRLRPSPLPTICRRPPPRSVSATSRSMTRTGSSMYGRRSSPRRPTGRPGSGRSPSPTQRARRSDRRP